MSATRGQLARALTDGGRGMSKGRDRQRARGALVVVQVALALVLIVGSGLMIRTFMTLSRVEPGFTRPDEVQLVYVPVNLPDPDLTNRTQHAIIDALAAVPGVTSAAFGDRAPLGPENRGGDTVLTVERPITPRAEGQPKPLRRFEFISPGYFHTYGMTIVAGRDLTWTDLDDTRQVAIVSAELARQEWGGADAAIGQRVQITPADPWREVVGVAGDVLDNGVQAPAPPIIYFPSRVDRFWGSPKIAFGAGTFAVRSTRAGSEPLLRDIERAVARVNASLPVAQARRLSDVYRGSLARTSFALTLLLIAGAMGLLLGVIGIYGVVAYGVSLRTREIGIRLALGAQPAGVTRLFLRRGLTLALLGLAAGLTAASMLTRLMASLIFGVGPIDPLTFGAAALLVLVVVAAAAWLPAHRAARRPATDALRAT